MAETVLCGIDIGTTKVATVVGILPDESDQIRIIGFNSSPSKGIKKGMIVDIDGAISSVESSIEKVERMAGHRVKSAFVSVGGPHIQSLNSHGIVAVSNPQFEVVEPDVIRVIEAARAISISNTRQIIEVSPREYSVDGQGGINNPVGMSGVRLEVDTHIITASTTNLKNIDKVLNDLGIVNQGFIFSGLASSEIVATDTERDLGVAVVDIGGGKIDMCIFVEGALAYSSSIPIGARHISNDIAVGLRISLDSAEKVKLYLSHKEAQVHQAITSKDKGFFNEVQQTIPEKLPEVSVKEVVDGIIGPRLEEIFGFVRQELIKSGYDKNVPSGVVLTGGGAQTIGIVDMGKRLLRLPIRVGVPENAVGLVDEIRNPAYSTTLGLIYYGNNVLNESQPGFKNFGHMFQNFSSGQIFKKISTFFKQFLP